MPCNYSSVVLEENQSGSFSNKYSLDDGKWIWWCKAHWLTLVWWINKQRLSHLEFFVQPICRLINFHSLLYPVYILQIISVLWQDDQTWSDFIMASLKMTLHSETSVTSINKWNLSGYLFKVLRKHCYGVDVLM